MRASATMMVRFGLDRERLKKLRPDRKGTTRGSRMSSLAQSFNLTNESNILRLICGLFFIPHIYAKFFVPEALGFFKAAKFHPPAAWLYAACIIETIVAIGLIF